MSTSFQKELPTHALRVQLRSRSMWKVLTIPTYLYVVTVQVGSSFPHWDTTPMLTAYHHVSPFGPVTLGACQELNYLGLPRIS